MPVNERTVWVQSELMRHSARDIAEAGRELGRFDSRPWLRPLPIPSAVVLTTRDGAVSPGKQDAHPLDVSDMEVSATSWEVTSRISTSDARSSALEYRAPRTPRR